MALDIFLLSLGGILFLGLLTSTVAARTFLPRVTMLLLLGVLIGDHGLQILSGRFSQHFDVIANLTLMMVGFLLGGKLNKETFTRSAKQVVWISVTTAVVTALVVCFGLLSMGVGFEISLLLGTIAAATAPAAVVDVVSESGIDNRFTDSLLSIVALDDVWALLLFALAMAVVANAGSAVTDFAFLFQSLREVVGAIGLGVLLGIPAAFLTGRIREGQPMLLEAVGVVALCGGMALWLEVSYLIACIVLGSVVVNLAKHHESPFHAIEDIESLFLIVFFVVAGASLELHALKAIGYLGALYIVLRSLGKYFGAWLGACLGQADQSTSHWMRFALLPQAGVSIGMALVASTHFPKYQQTLLTLVISSTVFFEIIGPIYTRWAITRAAGQSERQEE
ncbi:MAG: cation:proton antiporter [Arenicella sp.]|nr:cation:proton antiporter [Arenicella sp.]